MRVAIIVVYKNDNRFDTVEKVFLGVNEEEAQDKLQQFINEFEKEEENFWDDTYHDDLFFSEL